VSILLNHFRYLRSALPPLHRGAVR
jgi:hypothetical protein